jgi:hypothetical protein
MNRLLALHAFRTVDGTTTVIDRWYNNLGSVQTLSRVPSHSAAGLDF